MELRHLRYFQAVAEELHFGRAAERLHISQPPLSTQIKDLENELGVLLLERTRRQVKLTNCGLVFLNRVRSVLADIEAAADEVSRIDRGDIDRVTIGYRSSFVLQNIAPCLNGLRKMFPNVDIRLVQATTAAQYDAVRNHSMDVGFVDAPPISHSSDTSAITGTSVVRMRLAMAMPIDHPLAGKKRVRLQDFANDDFVMTDRASVPTVHDLQIGLCQRAGFSPRARVYSTQLPETLAFVAAGAGVAFATEELIGSWPGMIHFAKLEEKAHVTIFAIYRRDNDGKAVQAFSQYLENR